MHWGWLGWDSFPALKLLATVQGLATHEQLDHAPVDVNRAGANPGPQTCINKTAIGQPIFQAETFLDGKL
jgi:hypothetical protein